jgi:hypothetical protein
LWILWKTSSGQNLLSGERLLVHAGTLQHFFKCCGLA